MDAALSLVEEIRAASRAMVRELGFMHPTLAGTDYSPSAVHALLEISAHGSMTAAQLVQVLGLEKSSVSRMLGKLVKAGELAESAGQADGRYKHLQLTGQGERTVKAIHAYGQSQVHRAMQQLNGVQQQTVAQGLAAYAQALQVGRSADAPAKKPDAIAVSAGYRPGLVGRVTEMHASFYAKHAGFGQFFESQVATGMAEFVARLDQPCNGIWVATYHDRVVGAVAIDGQDLGQQQAHLRWFIVEDGCRGVGVGRRLLAEALAFCDRQGFAATQLWTFKGLDAARKLYEEWGFVLMHEEQGSQWGSSVIEQQFTRRASPSA
ncbi:bifunctional helix-turn-helix transcriptional regulator/GNAT family N-acetyltransferase [Curvibacter sp. CHRR-16]|uniref:bifunctional helix-turn-helix transcriptional regulator/GNAT family N-acetyltransferase n=1 Tax=Curvibacter sp. CHRR-16 TaxID=2835872 RepID=UPI001BD93D12|nr:bifunctional helix-turn-helix transcriptional regulator/GNAT family N-acetyltransferase [Curvibacter sp. CHRR-16]MBT0569136.1 bifunctional helix-turn-helix transcriptional regulator/GNAT family N-acetyltransferase [Curvibacter sp. CHRR-16]